jgi:uncharacterized protein (DUF1778 family)
MVEKQAFLMVRVTEEQRDALSDAAYKVRKSMSALVRQSVAATLREVEPSAAELWNTKTKAA